jgi:hypothetical protein
MDHAIAVKGGKAHVKLTLPRQGVALVRIKRVAVEGLKRRVN